MVTHKLKTITFFFANVLAGVKNFEIRKNDRNFQMGDTVILREYDSVLKVYSGREITATVGFVTDFMQTKDYVVFSLIDPARTA